MPIAEPPSVEPDAAPPSFRPPPVLIVAVAGHRGLSADETARIEAAALPLFEALTREAARVAVADAAFFDGTPSRLRVVARVSGESDLAMLAAAERAGCELRAILPWGARHTSTWVPPPPPFGRSPSPVGGGDADGASSSLPPAGEGDHAQHGGGGYATLERTHQAPLDLAGEAGDAYRAAEAGQAMLDRADILVAFWRGEPDPSPGSVAALVQQAVNRRMPVLLLPVREGDGVQVIDDPENHLLPPLAVVLPRIDLGGNLDRVVARAFAAPAGAFERQALAECLAERAAPHSRRPEYRALLAIAARLRPATSALSSEEEWRRAEAVAALVSPEAAAGVVRMRRLQIRMEELAAFYGERARSGVVLRYGMPAVGAVFIALLAVALPQYSLAWLGVQAVVMTLLVSESTWGARRRWGERWLDYRSLAERLRCDRFLNPCGIGSRRIEDETSAEDPAWMRWVHRRIQNGEWAGGTVSPAVVAAALRHLDEVEIPGQLRYHQGAAIRHRSLGRRLGLIASASAGGMLAASLILLVLPTGGPWLGVVANLLLSLLIVLPSLFLASRGLRAEGGYELAASRSAEAAATLRRLSRLIEASPPEYGRLVRASLTAARAMILDTVDWRVGLQRSRTPYRGEPEAPKGGGAGRSTDGRPAAR